MKRKTLRKIGFLLIILPTIFGSAAWVYTRYMLKIDTAEVDKYYDILCKYGKSPATLVYELDIGPGSGLQTITDELKKSMGLSGYKIWAGHGETGQRPAYVTSLAPGVVTVTVSKRVSDQREQINVLIHELSHIYVWGMDKSAIEKCNEEKLVDCTGVFLGLGILMLNGLTDESVFMPGTDHYSQQRLYGYIKPEQLGYLLARYCEERNIPYKKVMASLESPGRRYFNMGYNYMKRRAS
jgi:hypothetical protein